MGDVSGDVAGARLKLQRAEQHVRDFVGGFDVFLRDNPIRVRHDPDGAGGTRAKFVRETAYPPSLVCVVGDAVHNLRSALDHLACAVAKRNGVDAKGLKTTAFTIRETAADFAAALAERKVSRIGVPWADFLRRVEPYHGGKGSDLCIVGALDNLDKHRNLIVVETYGDTHIWDESRGTYVPVARGLSFKDGIEITLDPADPNYHTHSQTRVSIGESIPGLDPDEWAHTVLEGLVRSVRETIDAAVVDASLWP